MPELEDELLELELELEDELVELLLELEEELDELDALLEVELELPPQAANNTDTTSATDILLKPDITQPYDLMIIIRLHGIE